jgi:hypothetical protein
MMNWVRLGGGILLLLVGGVWSLQGAGAVGGDAMSGKSQWLVIGVVVALVGVFLIVGGVRKLRAGQGG